jgi:hypothetical protein
MKLVLLALSLAASAQAQSYNYSAICASATKSNDCPTVSGCIWEKDSVGNWYCHDGHDYVNCVNRTATDCEDDDSCFLTNNKGTKTCTAVNLGSGTQGDWCQSYYLNDTDGGVYLEVAGYGCAEGYICSVGNETGSAPGVPINGTCASTTCLGKKVPGNCGTSNGPNDQCNQTTERVTICHRTCSEKNPWVRITIDDDAWDGDGCGHMREHHVEIDCKNKAPWTAWGPNRSDYLIKFHGTRDHVRTINNFNTAEEKAYWRYWEPACPYVRQDKCCDWSLGSCCGAKTLPTYTPLVQVEKYAGPPGACSLNMSGELVADVYTVPNTTAPWAYCYKVSVPSNSECLYNMEMSDSAPIGGIGAGYELTTPVAKPDYTSLMEAETMCPGDVKYVPGPTIPDLTAPELGYDACVVGTGIMSGKDTSACNPAGVTVVLKPNITVTKYAGPPGSCPVDMSSPSFGSPLQADTYTTLDGTFAFCYYVENIGNECLLQGKMTDTAEYGVGSYTLPEKFCPGDHVVVAGPNSTTGTRVPPPDASVCAVGMTSGQKVCAANPAAVDVPTCPGDMSNPGSSYCGGSGVVPVKVEGAPKRASDIDIMYGVSSSDGGASVTFNVANPYEASMNMYVQYHAPLSTGGGGWKEACDDMSAGNCGAMTSITADCLYGDGTPFTLVQVYFWDKTGATTIFDAGVTVDQCCGNLPPANPSGAIAQYSFILACQCPMASRRLGEESIAKMLALFEQ